MIEYESLLNSNIQFAEAYKKAFAEVLDSGWYILGNKVKEFEKKFSSYTGSRHTLGVASGLDALLLALKALDLPSGSEVIVPSNTYIATILAILNAGLKPVLVEPDIRTYNIDPLEIEAAITPRTSAMMIVHLYGKPCEMDAIMNIKHKTGLPLIEDCAQAHGATFHGRQIGTFGEFGAFSFYPTKNLGALGDAGAVTTDDDGLALKIKRLRNYGSDVKYYNEVIGYNSRLDEVQATLLTVKLQFLDAINTHKRKLASLYLSELKSDFVLPATDAGVTDVYHIFAVRHPERDRLRQYLLEHGVKTEIHYPVPPHKQNAMQGILDQGHYPIAEEIHKTILSLPCSYGNTEAEIEQVIDIMNRF